MVVLLWTMAISCPEQSAAASLEEADFSENAEFIDDYFTNVHTIMHTVKGGAMNGEPAYCLENQFKSPKGIHFSKNITVDKRVQYCLRNGYPNNSETIAGIALGSTTEAYFATKLAIWRSAQEADGFRAVPIVLGDIITKNAAGKRIVAAATALYKASKSGYAVPAVPSHPNPVFTLPDKNEKVLIPDPKRPDSYVMAGPFSGNIPEETYMSDSAYTAILASAPADSYIGDASGGKVTELKSDAKYYIFIPADAAELLSPGSAKVDLAASYDYEYESGFEVTAFSSTEAQNMAIAAKPTFTKSPISAEATFGIAWTDEVSIGCEVDIDTINLTSAGYRSIAGEEGFNNVDKETYHYDVDYRSTSGTYADEFVVDDPLDAAKDGLIRLATLWTPVCWGDYDGKMNIWYKTNLTDSTKEYSAKSAMGTNPFNPGNPSQKAVYPNTGYKLWASGISTDSQTKLSVADLKLAEGEYITGMRYEHGRVNRGFTTKNYASESKNLVAKTDIDWTPTAESPYYEKDAAKAKGLKPITYLVTCPEPLKSSTLIANDVAADIARNIVLTDHDTDEVGTYPIDTFTVEPKAAPPEFKNSLYGIPSYEIHNPTPVPEPKIVPEEPIATLGLPELLVEQPMQEIIPVVPVVPSFPIVPITPVVPTTPDEPSPSETPKTNDGFPIAAVLISCFGALLVGILVFIFRGRLKHFKTICIVLAVATAGMFSIGTVAVFGEDQQAAQPTQPQQAQQNFIFNACGEISLDSYENSGGKDSFESKVYIDNGLYCGYVYLKDVKSTPNYESFERKVDKTEVYSHLDEEEVLYLPSEADFEVTTDEDLDSLKTVSLQRAGLKLEVTDEDSSGIPCEWEATVVFRGLEQYRDVHSYNSEAVYEGVLAKK
jgi:hypothetical protein